jgi:hypothetical protein
VILPARVVSIALLLMALAFLGACASEEVNSEPEAAATVTETVEAGATDEETTEETTEEAPPPEPELTTSQENAIEAAQNYLEFSAFSRQGLIEQLSSEYGDGFPKKDATFAVDYLDPNWKKEAAEAAKNYLDVSAFSRQGLIEQLESDYGDQFTHAQAVYGVNQAGL